jgi:6-phosphogluconolactonase
LIRRLLRLLSAAGLSVLAAGAVATAPVIVSAADDVTHVYVNDNTSGTNTVAAFERRADGTLAPLPGSPFAAGGAGTGTIVGSQGSIQANTNGRYLLVADAGSNQISVLRIKHDGSLVQVGSDSVWSGGIEPVSIAVHGNLVYVANKGNGATGSNYTGFRLSRSGHLTPIEGSTVPLSPTALPGDILFNSTGDNLVGLEVGPSLIDSFSVGDGGRLTPAAGSPFAAQSLGPFGSEFSPVNPAHLYVSNAHAGAGLGSVSAFDVTETGGISSIGSSPYADNQTAPCWVEITHNGRFLFAVNTASTTISRYEIHSDGSLQLLGSTAFKSSGGVSPFDARLDPSGSTLYVVDAGLDAVSAFAVSGGSLTELPQSPFALPHGATPFGIVAV